MKTIHTNHMVAHLWANQSQPNARTSNGNYQFTGDTLYSYQTPIARIVQGIDGHNVALVTCERYSNTTQGKHIGPAHRACGYVSFSVPFLGVTGGRHRIDSYDMVEVHKGNLAHLVAAYQGECDRMRRQRGYILPASVDSNLNRPWREVVRYCDAFGLERPAIDVGADANSLVAFLEAREALRNDPAAVARRAAERARWETLVEAREASQREQARQAASEALREWLVGERPTSTLPQGARRDAQGGAYLRVRGDVLETSLGATVPLAHAIRVFRFVAACRENGESYGQHPADRGPISFHVGHFTVNQVNSDGSFIAGCHQINWPEIERVARIVGVIPPEVIPGATAHLVPTEALSVA